MSTLAHAADAAELPALAAWLRGPWRILEGDGAGLEGELVGVSPHPEHDWIVGLFIQTPGGRVPSWSSQAVHVEAHRAKHTPHLLDVNGTWYADTNAVRAASAWGEVEHVGFGDFRVRGRSGDVHFSRADHVQIPGQVGRAHRLDGEPHQVSSLVEALRAHRVANPAGWTPVPGGSKRASADGRVVWIMHDRQGAPAFYGGPRRKVWRTYLVPQGERPGGLNTVGLGSRFSFAAAAELAGFRANPLRGEEYVPWTVVEPRLRSMHQVGPSADWSDTAYQLASRPDTVLFEEEDDRWLVLRRFTPEDRYAGMPAHLRPEYEGAEVIEQVGVFDTPTQALEWFEAGGLQRVNPLSRSRPVRVRVPGVRAGEVVSLVRSYLGSEEPSEWDEARTRLLDAGVDVSRLRPRPPLPSDLRRAELRELVQAYHHADDPSEWDEARSRLLDAGVSLGALSTRRRNPSWPADAEPNDDAADNVVRWRAEMRSFASWLAGVSGRAGFPELARALERVASDPLASGSPRAPEAPSGAVEAALETDPYGQTESVRRRANVAALRVLRAHQAERGPGGRMRSLAPGERQVLRQYSGMGGIEIDKLTAAERTLYTPEQQEYLRIQDVRTQETQRILLERKRKPKATELTQFGRVRGAFEGMIAQYFTPVDVAGGMVEWAMRVYEGVNGGTRPNTILEPSAGIGRFLRAYELGGFGGSPRWDAVELDPDLADMLRLLYADQPGPTPRWGDVRVHQMAFERFYAANAAERFDLVVANPPYAGRGPTAGADPAGEGWADAAHYFMWRTLTMLRPRGVMVHLVPAGVLTGTDKQSRTIREALLLEGHMASAVMPPYEIFPQALLNLCISVWVRRPVKLDRVLPEDQAILDGRYFESPDTRQGIMGAPLGGHYRPDAISGSWSIEKLRAQPIRVPPAALLAGAPAPALAPPRQRSRTDQAALAGLAREEGYEDADVVAMAEALGARVMRFRAALETDPAEARSGQPELQQDLRDFAATVGGRPHSIRAARQSPRLLAFLSAFTDGGELTPAITSTVDVPAGVYQGERTPRAVCLHIASQRGEAYLPDIEAVLGRRVNAAELVLEPDVWFDPLHDDERGPLVFLRAEEWFSGEAYPRMDWCDAVANGRARFPVPLGPVQVNALADKLRAGARRLLELVAPLPIGEIDIGIRSAWVHLTRREESNEWDCPLFVDYCRELLHVDVERVYVLQGVLVAEGAGARHPAVQGLLAYFNRVEHTYNERGQRNRRQAEDSLEERIAADRKADEQFAAFVRRHPTAPAVEDHYNRVFRGWIERTYSKEPIALARMPAEQRRRIRPHVWAAVRRAVERRGGIMALDVGLGKTASCLLAIALLRQQGRVRRPCFVVPNSVGPNWLNEIAMWLPDYRAVLVGSTVRREADGSLRTTPDSPQKMLAKLQAFASGRFDCAVIQQSTFERISVDPDRVRAFFEDEFGVQREVALQKRAERAAAERLEALQKDLVSATGKKREQLQDQIDQALVTPWIERLQAKLEAARREGNKKEEKKVLAALDRYAKKQSPTDRQRQTDQQRFAEWVDERVKRHRLAIDGITWEELHADCLVVDEAHEYKNLYGPASRYGKKPKYMGAMSADKVVGKCWDLWAKAALLRSTREDTGVLLLTATPLKNSPLEVYNLLSYCTRAAFQARGILDPEGFVERFCRPESEPVLTVMGGFREDLVVKTFTNLHELRGITATFVDVKVALPPAEYAHAKADGRVMSNIVELPLPTARPLTIHVPMDTNQEAYYDEYRREAARAAEQAAATLCERAVRQLEGDPSQLPRLRLPMLSGPDTYPIMVRTLHALATQHADVWAEGIRTAVRTLDLTGMRSFKDLEAAEDDNRAQAEVARMYSQWRSYLENTDVRGSLRMDDPELGTYGTRASSKAAPEGEGEAARTYVADDVPDEEEEGEEDDLFTIMDRMNKAALDLRLLGEAVDQHPPKYRAVAQKIKGMPGCGHIIFSDINETHGWIAAALVEVAGVPRERIVSITGAVSPGERQALADKLNGSWDAERKEWIRKPEVDVVIGGRAIEQGMNLQERSCAIHHLSFPWEPATIQQRNGRAVRQGNRLDDVFIFYYVAARSFDGYRLSLITGKRGWQRTLLESADRSTNNPGAELTGPCAMLRQLSADPELAEEYCRCLENAAAKKAEALRRERAAEDFASFIALTASARRDGPKQAHFAQEAATMRARLTALDDTVFPRKDLLDVADRVPLYWDLASGTPWIQGLPVCVASRPTLVVEVNPLNGTMRLRELGRWFTSTWSFGEAATRGSNVSATCDWDDALDRARLSSTYDLSYDTLRNVDPALFEARKQEAFAALNRAYVQLPYLTDRGGLVMEREASAPPAWRLLLPWTREDADGFLGGVRGMSRPERVARKQALAQYYTSYFGRVYPAELRDET